MSRPPGSKNKATIAKELSFSNAVPNIVTNETDEEIQIRLKRNQEIMEVMVKNLCERHSPSLIISGPPGLGKTYTAQRIIKLYDPNERKTAIRKGFTRATGLFKTLYNYRRKGNVIVFDDCDNVFLDAVALNLLKSACDSTERRRIFWGAESKMTDSTGTLIPNLFDFNGSIIFITNVDFDRAIAERHRLAPHFQALISRSNYINLDIKTTRDYLIKMKQLIDDGMLADRGLSDAQVKLVWFFINKHQNELRELSLRMAIRIGDFIRNYPKEWANMARVTCFKSNT
jgi:DNA polymerase III delta prime subunit